MVRMFFKFITVSLFISVAADSTANAQPTITETVDYLNDTLDRISQVSNTIGRDRYSYEFWYDAERCRAGFKGRMGTVTTYGINEFDPSSYTNENLLSVDLSKLAEDAKIFDEKPYSGTVQALARLYPMIIDMQFPCRDCVLGSRIYRFDDSIQEYPRNSPLGLRCSQVPSNPHDKVTTHDTCGLRLNQSGNAGVLFTPITIKLTTPQVEEGATLIRGLNKAIEHLFNLGVEQCGTGGQKNDLDSFFQQSN